MYTPTTLDAVGFLLILALFIAIEVLLNIVANVPYVSTL